MQIRELLKQWQNNGEERKNDRRKKLIVEIRELKNHYDFFYKEGRSEVDDAVKNASDTLFNDVAKIIYKQPKAGEWIPCSERLPGSSYDVEVTCKNGVRGIGFYSGGRWYNSMTHAIADVIAWKEPSEPWEGEK